VHPSPQPAESIPEVSPERRSGRRPGERPRPAGRPDAYQLHLLPPEAAAARPEGTGDGPLRVHLFLRDTAVFRTAWAAVSREPDVRVVSTVFSAPVEADVRVEAISPPYEGSAEGDPGANPSSAARVLAVIPDETDEALAAALSRGAWAVVREGSIGDSLVSNLLAIGRGECPILRAAAGRASLAAALIRRYRRREGSGTSGPALPNPLTGRETAILGAIALGQTSPAIALRFGIGVQTVKNHVTQIFRKTGARTRPEAVNVANQYGWLAEAVRHPSSSRPGPDGVEDASAAPGERSSGTAGQIGLRRDAVL